MSIADLESIDPTTTVTSCALCAETKTVKPKKDGSGKVPHGWKVLGGHLHCGKCKARKYKLRAVTIPIVGPLDKELWPELRKSLASGWGSVTSLSNWTLQELFKRDTLRTPDQTKLAKWEPPYLYQEARQRFPEVPSALVPTIQQQVAGKYRTKRYEALWTNSASVPTYRYPQPYPIRAADWKAEYGPDNVPLIRCNIAGTKYTIKLRGGHQFARQLKAFRQLIEGKADQSELAFYRVKANDNDNRSGEKSKGQQYRIMAKMCLWLPKEDQVRNPKERPKNNFGISV
jgi:hypothetical protein